MTAGISKRASDGISRAGSHNLSLLVDFVKREPPVQIFDLQMILPIHATRDNIIASAPNGKYLLNTFKALLVVNTDNEKS